MNFCNFNTIPMNIVDMKHIYNKMYNMVDMKLPQIYKFNGNGNLQDLESNNYLLTFKTSGAKFFLLLTTINGKKYSLFICYDNPKDLKIYNVKLRFSRDLYNDTIFEGEILLNNKNNYIFMINNILYNKGYYIGNKLLGERIGIISDILRKHYKFDDFLNCCHLQMRSYFLINHLEMMSDSHNNELLLIPERINGYTFSLTIKNLSDNQKIITNLSENVAKKDVNKFYVKRTEMPDVFELYESNNLTQDNFRGIACIPTKSYSFYMKKLFDEQEDDQKVLLLNFVYNNYLKGWEPKVESN